MGSNYTELTEKSLIIPIFLYLAGEKPFQKKTIITFETGAAS